MPEHRLTFLRDRRETEMKIDIFLTKTIDNIIMTHDGTLLRYYFPSRAQIFIKHDTIYHFDGYTPEFQAETEFDADVERRCAQIINHELSHAAQPPWMQIISSRHFQILMLVMSVVFNILAIILAIIFLELWTMTFFFLSIIFAYLAYKSDDLKIKYEDEAKQAEASTDMNNGYKGINKALFGKIKAMK